MRITSYILGIVFLLVLIAPPVTISAMTYTVTTMADGGPGSLRQAIIVTNGHSGTDSITFDIPGPGPHTIRPTSPLPEITMSVVIDGYTQPGASPNTNNFEFGNNAVMKIELDGSLAGDLADGLYITYGFSRIQGLVINRFQQNGIKVEGGPRNFIMNNFIGTDVSGTTAMENRLAGVHIDGSYDNKVAGNILSGNDRYGILIEGEWSWDNLIQGNYIGTDVSGTSTVGNGSGISIWGGARDNLIGGTSSWVRNLISGNDYTGVFFTGPNTHGNKVLGNLIGTDISGINELENYLGVSFADDASANCIGDTVSGAGNTIAFNACHGIKNMFSIENAILSNSIFSNDSLGIELGTGGEVTPNDAGDGDTGANNLQNFPVLTSAHPDIVYGTFNSTPDTEFRLEFFSNSECDLSGHGEGERYLGAIMVTTTSSGNVDFSFASAVSITTDMLITSTATDPDDNTSEFSECIAVTSGLFDVGVAHIDYPSPVWYGYTIPATIGMINTGSDDALGAMGSYSILNQDQNPLDGYPQTFGPMDIPAGGTKTYQFQWTPLDIGTYFILACCQSDDDKNHGNDTLTVEVQVHDKSHGTVGDVNDDGQSNVLDAVYLINYILGTVEFSDLELYRSDCNRDGAKNILDVLGIINGILGIGSCASACEELDCDDGNPCTFDYCDSILVQCVHEPLENGSPCDDGDACTEYDKCIDGACQGTVKDCDDGDPCTADGCDPASGCKHEELCCDNGSDDDGDGYPDCDDDDCLADGDGDGYYAPPCGGDCDDGNAAVHPGATEICGDGVDNDCDGSADCDDDDCLVDGDGDGHYADPCGDDCDDGNNTVYPGAPEICTDGLDNDCDGPVDCNDDDCLVDGDGDGYDAPPCGSDCNDGNGSIHPGADENCTDGNDNDCDGSTDCTDSDCRVDADGDGHYAPPCGQDCDDNDNTVYPGAPEICDDGVDNDCNQAVDCQDNNCWIDADGDQYYAQPCGDDCDDDDKYINPGAQENCQDKVDNDCDGKTDCDDEDCYNDPNGP